MEKLSARLRRASKVILVTDSKNFVNAAVNLKKKTGVDPDEVIVDNIRCSSPKDVVKAMTRTYTEPFSFKVSTAIAGIGLAAPGLNDVVICRFANKDTMEALWRSRIIDGDGVVVQSEMFPVKDAPENVVEMFPASKDAVAEPEAVVEAVEDVEAMVGDSSESNGVSDEAPVVEAEKEPAPAVEAEESVRTEAPEEEPAVEDAVPHKVVDAKPIVKMRVRNADEVLEAKVIPVVEDGASEPAVEKAREEGPVEKADDVNKNVDVKKETPVEEAPKQSAGTIGKPEEEPRKKAGQKTGRSSRGIRFSIGPRALTSVDEVKGRVPAKNIVESDDVFIKSSTISSAALDKAAKMYVDGKDSKEVSAALGLKNRSALVTVFGERFVNEHTKKYVVFGGFYDGLVFTGHHWEKPQELVDKVREYIKYGLLSRDEIVEHLTTEGTKVTRQSVDMIFDVKSQRYVETGEMDKETGKPKTKRIEERYDESISTLYVDNLKNAVGKALSDEEIKKLDVVAEQMLAATFAEIGKDDGGLVLQNAIKSSGIARGEFVYERLLPIYERAREIVNSPMGSLGGPEAFSAK